MKLDYIPYNTELKKKARNNRNNPTKPELIIWNEILRNKMTGYRFVRQKPIDNFIIDFYCAELLLGIEIDGDSHFESKVIQKYDEHRTKILKNYEIKIIRYKNNDIMYNLNGVYKDLIINISERKKEIGK